MAITSEIAAKSRFIGTFGNGMFSCHCGRIRHGADAGGNLGTKKRRIAPTRPR
jgi:hypothetical protein